jgi:hypothetical protein
MFINPVGVGAKPVIERDEPRAFTNRYPGLLLSWVNPLDTLPMRFVYKAQDRPVGLEPLRRITPWI